MMSSAALANPGDVRVNGQGMLNDGRTFNVNAVLYQDGTVRGHATLINTAFSGDSGRGPFRAKIDINCVQQLDDNTVIIGGFVRSTNDSNLIDSVFFAVRDDGKDDKLSRAFFFDGDPTTVDTDPNRCKLTTLANTPLEEVIRGNLRVH
jgi:hypothetical protein